MRASNVLTGFIAAFYFMLASANAQENCHERGGQYATNRTCASSVLPAAGGHSFGPDHLDGDSDKTWCAAAGSGAGQTITLHQSEPVKIATLMFVNGDTRSAGTFSASGRIKRAIIETNRGQRKDVTFKDTADPQWIRIKPAQLKWAKLTVLSIYPGAAGSGICASAFQLNQEEFNNM